MYNYLKQLEQHVDAGSLKEDLRKLGINLITAGVIGVFITHAADANFAIIISSISIIFSGAMFCYFGIRK